MSLEGSKTLLRPPSYVISLGYITSNLPSVLPSCHSCFAGCAHYATALLHHAKWTLSLGAGLITFRVSRPCVYHFCYRALVGLVRLIAAGLDAPLRQLPHHMVCISDRKG
jgi:hypothetical protein